MHCILYDISYILYAIYISWQLLFGSEGFSPHHVLYVVCTLRLTMRGSSDDEDDDVDDDTQTSYSGLKVSNPIKYYILHQLPYIPYAIYVKS